MIAQILTWRRSAATTHRQRRRIKINHRIVAGGAIVGLVFLAALLAPLFAPHDPYMQNLAIRLRPPVWSPRGTWDHILGTDQLGRDYLSRLIYGSRIALLIGFATVAISGIIGVALGTIAGYFRGRVDLVVSFLITARLAMPAVLVALAVVGAIGNSLQTVILVLGFLLWDRFAVVTRSAVMQVSSQDYVAAAEAIGCSPWRIMTREILPNIMPALVVVGTLEIGHAVLLEAALSFLGLGVQPPIPSWGLMIAEGRNQLFFLPTMVLFPGMALLVLILGINMLGDGLRDAMMPGEVR